LKALERPGEVEAGARVVGTRAQHLAKGLGRLAVAALLEEHAAERLVRGDGARRQRHRRARLGLGVGGAAQAAEDDDEIESGREVVGPRRDRLAEGGGGVREPAAARLRARALATRLEAVHHPGRHLVMAAGGGQRAGRGRSKIAAIM